jgi:hypothetical protein
LLQDEALLAATHPSEGIEDFRIPRNEIDAIETGQILLITWLGVLASQRTCLWPFRAHNADVVEEFVHELKLFLFQSPKRWPVRETLTFGGPPSLKLSRAESAELDPAEIVLARLWSGSLREGSIRSSKTVPDAPRQDYVAITNRRLLWITNHHRGRARRYGTISRSAPMARLSRATFLAQDAAECIFEFGNNASWRIPVSELQQRDVQCFIAEVGRLISYAKR